MNDQESRLVEKMLVVDDDPGMRALVIRCLSRFNARVFEADNGLEAIEAATRELPDLILLDNFMPGMKGLDVAGELRKNNRLDGSTIVMISSDSEPPSADRMKLPYHGWILKPFKPLQLLEEVTRIIETSRWTPRPFIRKDRTP